MADYDVVIIGGGISGLSALHYLKKYKPDWSVLLLEKDKRIGGTIGTDHIDDYSFDWGPNGFLDREPLTLELCEQIGLKDQLERANANVSNRFILRDGKLRAVPMSPPAFVTSDILPLLGKLRVFFEPWAKSRPEGVDESIYDFVKRRIGRDAADYLVQPMVSGVYGGVAERMSLKSCFPIMREMEDEYGGLFKAMIAKAKKAKKGKKAGKKSGGPSGPGGWLTSFQGGLSIFADQFEKYYSDSIKCGAGVETMAKSGGLFSLSLSDGDTVTSKQVIVAVPANYAREITRNLSSEISNCFGSIPYAPIAVVCLGYDKSQIGAELDGFGFLVPAKEKLGILGSIWTSSIFDSRAPEGKVQFRTMVGGDGDHESAGLSESDLLDVVKRDLGKIMKISGEPELVKTYRWKYGIPQFKVGHSEIIDQLETELRELGGLHVTGNAYYGIGLNDCIKQSHRVVASL